VTEHWINPFEAAAIRSSEKMMLEARNGTGFNALPSREKLAVFETINAWNRHNQLVWTNSAGTTSKQAREHFDHQYRVKRDNLKNAESSQHAILSWGARPRDQL
jgi:hypothetical protein